MGCRPYVKLKSTRPMHFLKFVRNLVIARFAIDSNEARRCLSPQELSQHHE